VLFQLVIDLIVAGKIASFELGEGDTAGVVDVANGRSFKDAIM
jgi:hypothetical protein